MKWSVFMSGALSLALVFASYSLGASEQNIPEPFRGATAGSNHKINYDDLNELLEKMVVDVGRSNRGAASQNVARTGTRTKSSHNKYTATEGNRFYFEAFEDNERNKQALLLLRQSLEQVPAQAKLSYFSKEEQLAYWLNLYNVTMLNEIVNIYPKKNLKKYIEGNKSVKTRKILNVAGVALSLDDIQYTILKEKYNSDPLILYGLYQGVIGGPNIRKRAYTGINVYRYLKNNAIEFINSNRGTRPYRGVFQVAGLYERNEQYFENFDDDLTAHLLLYIQGEERDELMAANKLKPAIEDWSVTDIYGTERDYGGRINSNSAALIGASVSNVPESGFIDTSSLGNTLVGRPDNTQRFSPQLTALLEKIRANDPEAVDKRGEVTITEIYPESTETNDEEEKQQ